MKRFVEAGDRRQATLLPDSLEDYVTEDNPVRVVDVFIDELDLEALGFSGVAPEVTGRPAYHPATLLKIYRYGYLNRIQSSRRLETGKPTQHRADVADRRRLMPDFKTIADFRRDSRPAIRAACAQFVVLCRQFNLFRGLSTFTRSTGASSRRSTIATRTSRWPRSPSALNRWRPASRATWGSWTVPTGRTAIWPRPRQLRLEEKIRGPAAAVQSLRGDWQARVEAAPDEQVSLTDPDARSMATSGKGTGIVGYDVQIAVDAEHHLIVAA